MKFFKLAIVVFSIISVFRLDAQDILLDKNVEDSIMVPERGPNSKKFNHLFYSLETIVPFNEKGIDQNFLLSYGNEFGLRHKRKINKTLSFGYSFSYSLRNFNLKTDSSNIFPTNETFDKKIIRLNAFNIEFYQRISYGKRGNYMGIFTDFGVNASWNFNNKYITENHVGSPYAKKVITQNTQPNYIQPLKSSLIFRFGVNNIVLCIKYDITNNISQTFYKEDLEGIWIGLEIGLHR